MKKFRVILLLAAVMVFAALLYWDYQSGQEKEAYYQQMEETLSALEREQAELEEELEGLETAHEDEVTGIGTVVVLFTGVWEEVYTEAWPLMQERGYTGTLTLSETQMPGNEGCMTMEQFQELTEAGWGVCMSQEAYGKGLWSKVNMRQTGVVYYPEETYSLEVDEDISRKGGSIVVHHGEEELPLIVNKTEEGLWHAGAVGHMSSAPKRRLEDAVKERGNIVFTAGFDESEERVGELYNAKAFGNMLGYFAEYEARGQLKVTSLPEARSYREELEAAQADLIDGYEAARSELETKIQAKAVEIEAVKESYR